MKAFRDLPGRVPAIAWVLLLALVVIGAGIGLRDPWPADEPRFVLIARDMVLSGQWLFPHVGNVLYPDKPPLYFWIMAACYMVTGSLRVAFLLPSLLAALGTLWLVHDLGRRLWNERTGIFAALVLLATLQFVLQAKSAQIDATLAFFTTLGLYGLCRHLLLGPAWGWYVVGFAAAGAGVITKGVGFLPLLVFIPWAYALLARWPLPRIGGGWRWALGPLAMLTVIAAWLAPMLIAVHFANDLAFDAYRDNILFKQTAERYADAWHHVEPFWYYLVEVIPVFWLPVTLVLPWLVPAWSRALRAHDPRPLLLLGWVVLVVLFFSMSAGKRGLYILPAVPALALATAPCVDSLLRHRGVNLAGFGALAVIALLLLLTLLNFLVLRPEKGALLVERHEASPWLFVGLLIGAALAWMPLGPKRGMTALCGFFLTVWLIYGLYAYPAFNDARSPASMMRKAGAYIGPEAELALVNWREQLILHADRPVVHFGYRMRDDDAEVDAALRWLVRGERRYLLLPDEALNDCFLADTLHRLDFVHRRNWWLADVNTVTPACRERAQTAPEPDFVIAGKKR